MIFAIIIILIILFVGYIIYTQIKAIQDKINNLTNPKAIAGNITGGRI
jgi:hypothetical protein